MLFIPAKLAYGETGVCIEKEGEQSQCLVPPNTDIVYGHTPVLAFAGRKLHMETLINYTLGSMKFTTQDNLSSLGYVGCTEPEIEKDSRCVSHYGVPF